jgi:predicted  nucleic acid-binding Zn-ribbon protein
MERQLLEIQDAFSAFVDDVDRQRQDAERQKKDAEDRLRTIERQKQELEDQLRQVAGQLRKLQKTPTARIVRFFGKLNPVRSERKRIR